MGYEVTNSNSMNNQFMISKCLFSFVVTVFDKIVKIETRRGYESIPAFNYIAAETQEVVINSYLKRYNITKDLITQVKSFYSKRRWMIDNVRAKGVEETTTQTNLSGYRQLQEVNNCKSILN